MYLYLKPGAKSKFEQLKAEGIFGKRLELEESPMGRLFIRANNIEAGSSTNDKIPKLLFELIEEVTDKEWIFRGLKPDGVYRRGEAVLTAKTCPSSSIDDHSYRQEVSISGPSVEAVNEIYTLFRQGGLKPSENWDDDVPADSPIDETE